MLGNNRKKTETQYRNNNIDIYQIRFRSHSKKPIDNKKSHEMNVKIRIFISIQTNDIYRQKIRRIIKDRNENN